MDPASVLAIVNGSIDLALKCASVVKSLHDVASKHKYAELFLVSMIDECQTFHLAWGRIQSWAQIRQESTSTVDDQLVERLCSSLATGTMVLSALEQDLVNLGSAATPTEFLGFRRRNKTIWNEQVFRDHQDRLRGQIGAMTLLLGVVNLPTSMEQADFLTKEEHVLKAADEIAWTIVNSRAPTSIRDQDSLVSFESTELIYRRLSCEDDLFTAGVYNRNFRNRKIGGFFHDSAKARGKKVAELAPVDRPARDDEEDDNEHQPNTTEMQDGQARRCDLIEFSTKLSPDTSGFEVISPNQLVLDSPAPWSSISNGARTPDSSPTSDMSWTFTGSSERPEVSTRGTSLIASSQASICPIWLASNTLTNSLVSCRACDRNFKENPQDLESNMQRHLRYPLKHNTSAGLRCPQSECRRRPAMRSENLGPHLQNFQEMSSASERTVIIDESKLSARRERT